MTNIFVINGNLGRDPEWRASETGDGGVCRFTLAHNEGTGEDKRTSWFTVKVFGKQGQLCMDYLKKGSRPTVTGRVQVEQWEGRDGVKRTDVVVLASAFGVDFGPRQESREDSDDGGRW